MVSKENVKKTFAGLVSVDSPSLGERQMADHLKELFGGLGVELEEDDSAPVTGSSAGNLYGYLKEGGQPPVLLSAHMDTVMPALGKRAVFHEDDSITSDGTTVLGADDLSGITAIYEALRYLRERRMPHRDAELLFTTGEELYCRGAKAFDFGKIRSRDAIVLDLSGRIGDAAYAAPTIISFETRIIGKAAHAGFCPKEGIHAVRVCCEATALLPLGQLDETTTANIGVISGGEGVNIVPGTCTARGEIRSFSHEKAERLALHYRETFESCAQKYGAKAEWRQQTDIRAYETDRDSPVVRGYEKACAQAGIVPRLIRTFGGSDNNVFAQNGIEGIVIAPSMNNVHSCAEYANAAHIAKVSEILIALLSAV